MMRLKIILLLISVLILGYIASFIYAKVHGLHYHLGISDTFYYFFSIPAHYLIILLAMKRNLIGKYADVFLLCAGVSLYLLIRSYFGKYVELQDYIYITLSGLLTLALVYIFHSKIITESKATS